MMHKMRENTKIVLWVVVISFVITIFAVWGLDLQTGGGSGDPNVVGRVNGVAINRSQYQLAYEQLSNQFRSQGQSLTYSQERFIEDQAWNNLVYAILTDQVVEDLGITVSDQEIVDYLRFSPPIEVQQYFRDEQGQFNREAYLAALSNPENDWTVLEQLARERIPRIKLNEYLAAQVHVGEDEIRQAYLSENVKLEISYVEFLASESDLEGYSPSEEEIQDYYEAHRDDFKDPDKARVSIVKVPLAPSESDREDAKFTTGRVREQLLAGEEFGPLAKTFSDAPTSFADGNTGFIGRAQRDSTYFDVVDQLTAGEISPVFAAEDGFYVLKLIETQTSESGETEYSLQEILVKPAISRQTSDSLYTLVTDLKDRAVEVGFDEAAAQRDLEVLKPDPFIRNTAIGDVGLVLSVSDFAFDGEVGDVSGVLRDEDNLYLAKLEEIIPESFKPLEDVRSRITQVLYRDRRMAVAERSATAFYQKAKTSNFETAAETYGRTISSPDTFRVVEPLDHFGASSPVAEAALLIEPGQYTPPIELQGSYVVIHVKNRDDVNPDDIREQAGEIRQRLKTVKVQNYTTYWYEKLKEDSDIEDYRTQG